MNPRLRHAVLAAGLAGAAALVLFGERAPQDGIAEAVERPRRAAPAAAPVAAAAAVTAPEQGILALVPRAILVGDDDERFGADAAGPFARRDWNPPPPSAQPAAAPPPAAPPLPFTFIGKSVGAGVWEVYLARGDRTWIVRDKGTVIDGAWRVEAIAPPLLTLTYLPLNQVQQLNIGVFD